MANPSAVVDRALEKFESMHLTFDPSIVPRKNQRRQHGVVIPLDSERERPEIGGVCVDVPTSQRIGIVVCEKFKIDVAGQFFASCRDS